MRRRLLIAFAAILLTAYAGGAPAGMQAATPPRSTAASVLHVTPANIRRLGAEFPAGYEISDVAGARSPAGYWGLAEDFTSDPAQCAALADPVTGDAPPHGLDGSGAGGTVYAVVAESASPPVLDPDLLADCPHWSMDAGRTTATTELTSAPQIEGVLTVAMATAARTVVEGGIATDSRIQTVTAYLGDYLGFVAVVTDPGAAQPALAPEFAAALLVKAVAALRG